MKVPKNVIVARDQRGRSTAFALSAVALVLVKTFYRGIADRVIVAQGVDLPGVTELARRQKIIGELQDNFDGVAATLARRLRDGSIGLNDWQTRMRSAIKDIHVQSMIVSRGGDRSSLTFSDWGRVGGFLKSQYRYLNRYAAAIQDRALSTVASGGKVPFYSEKYIAFRSKLYGGAARATFYQGMAHGLLPQVPGDGKTECKTNCKCQLVFEDGEFPGLILVWWELQPAEHCVSCVELAASWNPLELWVPGAEIV